MNANSRKLYSATQIRELDRATVEGGIAGQVLMQRAGHAAWLALQRSRPNVGRIDIVCGAGNNGGDGYEIARLANGIGRDVRVWQVGPAPTSSDAATARSLWLKAGGAVQPFRADSLVGAEVVIDALLGIGVKRDLADDLAAAVAAINAAREQGAWVLAIDVPSGLDAGTGRICGTAVRANKTITFIGNKVGLYTGDGVDCAGEIVLDTLNISIRSEEVMAPLAFLHDESDLVTWLPKRTRNSHKGTHGHVLVIGGDGGMSGAALLAGQAALRSGTGLVTLATRGSHALVLTPAQPELMCRRAESVDELMPLISRATVIAIGPGLGTEGWGRALFARALVSNVPLVVDADALNLLAETSFKRDGWVLTPHPGEAARMLGVTTEEIQNDRPTAVVALQQRYGGTVVLKGAGTLVCGEKLSLCPYGNPGMAVGGMGDVLTGMIAACIAQGQPLEQAANTGVLAHALAGDRAASRGMRGLLPSDLLAELRAVVNP